MTRHCIAITFFNRIDSVARCLTALMAQRAHATEILLVDDGSTPGAWNHPALRRLLAEPRVHLIRHERNHGVSAARNSALHWCRAHGLDLVIMIDSDCTPGPDLIRQHLELQERFPDATAIAGAIVGTGNGVFAWIDGVLSWTNSRPHGDVRKSGANVVYHLPMTNIALRLSRLPEREAIYDERLHTGEDLLLIRELLQRGATMVSSPVPVVFHQDRETLRSLIAHHRQWGYHQYFLQFGGCFSRPVFHPLYRAAFLLAFGLALPGYVLIGSILNIAPWLRHRPAAALAWGPALLIWIAKGLAVMQAALNPRAALRPTRTTVTYVEMTARDGKRAGGVRTDVASERAVAIAAAV